MNAAIIYNSLLLILLMDRVVSFAIQGTKFGTRRAISTTKTSFAIQGTKFDTRRAISRRISTTTTLTMTNHKNGVIMVLSPAKTMDLRPLDQREDDYTQDGVDATTIANISKQYADTCCDMNKTKSISKEMKKKSGSQLKTLLGISDSLSKVSLGYWKDFNTDRDDNDIKPAAFTFSGPAYKGLDPSTCSKTTLSHMASHLFILDPVYGILPSLRTMQPYRLEMGIKLFGKDKLSTYWKDSVTTFLGKELKKNVPKSKKEDGPILVNLASDEYSSSIDPASLPKGSIFLNCVFKHKGRVLSVHAKRARGLMARYLSENEAKNLDDVSKFNLEGYSATSCWEPLDSGKKTGNDDILYEDTDLVGDEVRIVKMVFDRDEAPPKPTASKKRAAAGGEAKKPSKKKTKK